MSAGKERSQVIYLTELSEVRERNPRGVLELGLTVE